MLLVFLIACVALAIVLGAVRIILGWVLPAPTVHAIDRFVNKAGAIYLKLCVVGLACLILWFIYVAATA